MTSEKKSPNPWLMIALVWFASVAAPLNMVKVPACPVDLCMTYGIDPAGIGFLMSAYTITGIFMGLPGGWMIRKLGVRKTAVLALSVSAIGAIGSCFAPTFTMLMFFRVFEGIGVCVLGAIGITVAHGFFPPEKHGISVAIACSYFAGIACVGTPILSMICDNFGMHTTYVVCAVYNVIAIVVALFLKEPPVQEKAPSEKRSMWGVIKAHPALWLNCIVFFIHNFCIVGVVNNFGTTYLTTVVGLSQSTASLMSAIMALCSTLVLFVSGTLSDKLGTRKKLVFFAIAFSCIGVAAVFNMTGMAAIGICFAIAGIGSGMNTNMLQAIGPELVDDPEEKPIVPGLQAVFQNAGQFIAASTFGTVAVAVGFGTAALIMCVPLYIIAFICTIALKNVK